MNYEKHEKRLKSDKNMTDKYNSLTISFVKLCCHFVKLIAIERT